MAEKAQPPQPPPPSDQDLVAAINRGDWRAYDTLYYRYRDWTFRLACRFAGDQNEAQDVVQEVFVYLARKFRTGLELRAGMTSLLYPAVKHTALSLRRKRQKTRELSEHIDPPAAESRAVANATRSELADILSALSDAHRDVLLMRFVDDMSLEEIAAALAIPLGTVKSRLHHAILALRADARLRKYFQP